MSNRYGNKTCMHRYFTFNKNRLIQTHQIVDIYIYILVTVSISPGSLNEFRDFCSFHFFYMKIPKKNVQE